MAYQYAALSTSSVIKATAAAPAPTWAAWLKAPLLGGFSAQSVLAVATLAAAAAAATGGALAAGRGGDGGAIARADECAWSAYRLPTTVTPRAYSVSWELGAAFSPPFPFAGSAAVDVDVLDPAVECVLVHARDLSVSAAWAASPGGPAVALEFAPDAIAANERIVLRLPAALRGQSTLRLSFNFSGKLSNTVIGFYSSSFVNDATGAAVNIVQTKFEPAFARTAFPCFDEPALKANFTLALAGVPPGYVAIANMPPLAPVDGAGRIAFATTPRMSTYQLTAVIAPMVSVSGALPPAPALGRAAALPVTVWRMDRGNASSALAQQQTAGLNFALATAIATLGFYEDYASLSFPLPKLELVYLPVFPVGAMEQWGLVTYTESYLTRGNTSSPASVIAHELGHQQYGNLNTAEWWDCLWLQEGFATWYPYLSLPATNPSLRYEAGWRAATAGAMADDAFVASQALTAVVPPATSGASYAMFGSITYDKGSAVIARIQARVNAFSGKDAFRTGLAAYLRAHAYGAVRPPDLLASLSAAAALPTLADEVGALVYQAGVPLVTAAWAGAAPALALTQSRFFASAASAAAAAPATTTWTLPLTITAEHPGPALAAAIAAAATAAAGPAGGFSGSTLLAALPYSAGADGWLLLSNGTSAEYMRALYPPEDYEALARALARSLVDGDASAVVPAADARAALLDDVFALAEARTAPGVVNTSFALQWAARWAGFDAAPGVGSALSSHLARLRTLLVDDVADPGNAAQLPLALQPGTAQFACLQALARFSAAQFGLNLNLSAFAADRAAMSASLVGPFDASNVSGILSPVAASPAGRDLAWAFFKSNFAGIREGLGFRSTLATLVSSVARNFVSAPLYADVAAFFAPAIVASAPVVDGAWQRALENIEAARAWRESQDAAATCVYLLAAAPEAEARVAAGRSAIARAGVEENLLFEV